MVADARIHSDGSPCKAKSPESCPFEKRAEKADTALGTVGAGKSPAQIASMKRIATKEYGIPGPAVKEAMQRKGVSDSDVIDAVVNTLPADSKPKEIKAFTYDLTEDIDFALGMAGTGYDGPHTIDRLRKALPKDHPIFKIFGRV